VKSVKTVNSKEETMANTPEYIHKLVNTNTTRSRLDKGLTLTIKVTAYDNGLIQINQTVLGVRNRWLTTCRLVLQLLECFETKVKPLDQ
jgi:hypothetical protein